MNLKIDAVEVTGDRLAGRAGLPLFVSYLHNIELFPLLERYFESIRKSKKGVAVFEILKQVLCFMVDGTSRHVCYSDPLIKDTGCAGTIETDTRDMVSSHQVKRSFKGFAWTRVFLFRRLLQTLFIWRLTLTQPELIE